MVTGPRLVRSSASATLAAEQWRVDSAHNSPDPCNKDRMYVAVSAGGVYRTDDGGTTWQFAQQWSTRDVSARKISRVRTVRA